MTAYNRTVDTESAEYKSVLFGYLNFQSILDSSFFECFRHRGHVGCLKNSESKNCQFGLFENLQRTSGFHERVSGFLTGGLIFSNFREP
jgi:hypothetical protein